MCVDNSGVDASMPSDAFADARSDVPTADSRDGFADTLADAGGPDGSAGDALIEVLPPRPISPLSGATAGRRTLMRWSLAPGSDGAHVQICSDRACTTELTSFDAVGSQGTPPVDLPRGIVYWRLRGRAGAQTGTTWSATWSFVVGVGPATAPPGSVVLDLNADGFADVVVGAPDPGHSTAGLAHVFMGSAAGIPTRPTITLTGPDGASGQFGSSLAKAGDVNGDGFGDLVVGAPGVMGTGRAYVYLGSATGITTTPGFVLASADGAGARFGGSVSGATDLNGDGFTDVVIGSSNAFSGTGRVHVFMGSRTGTGTTPTMTLTGPDGFGAAFGGSVAEVGDLNSDGFSDIVVGASAFMTNTGRAYVYLGAATGPAAAPSLTLPAPRGGGFGYWVASAGDVNNDGFGDFVIGAPSVPGGGAVYVFLGSTTGSSATPIASIAAPDGGTFGSAVAGVGDVNGDGFADIMVGAPFGSASPQRAYLYLGNASPTAPALVPLPFPFTFSTRFGIALSGVGDVNGDGLADVVIGASDDQGWGNSYLYLGARSGTALTFAHAMSGLPTNDRFGASVAMMGLIRWIGVGPV